MTGLTIKGNTSSATGVILSVNATTIQYLPTSGTFVTGETISTDPASYAQITGSPFTVSSSPFTTLSIPKSALLVSTIYFARVKYATTNSLAATSSFSPWSSFTTSATFLPAIGQAYGGGYFAGQISTAGTGVADYNLIVAPVTSGSLNGQFGGSPAANVIWKTSASGDTNPPSQNQVYGATATTTFSSATYPMFNWAVSAPTGPNAGVYDATNVTGTGIGGFNDWYIPAKNELEILYYNLKPDTTTNNTGAGINPNAVPARASSYTAAVPAQTTADGTGVTANFRTGGSQTFFNSWYWPSSEVSTNVIDAWFQNFSNGNQLGNVKNTNGYARAIRRVAV